MVIIGGLTESLEIFTLQEFEVCSLRNAMVIPVIPFTTSRDKASLKCIFLNKYLINSSLTRVRYNCYSSELLEKDRQY